MIIIWAPGKFDGVPGVDDKLPMCGVQTSYWNAQWCRLTVLYKNKASFHFPNGFNVQKKKKWGKYLHEVLIHFPTIVRTRSDLVIRLFHETCSFWFQTVHQNESRIVAWTRSNLPADLGFSLQKTFSKTMNGKFGWRVSGGAPIPCYMSSWHPYRPSFLFTPSPMVTWKPVFYTFQTVTVGCIQVHDFMLQREVLRVRSDFEFGTKAEPIQHETQWIW